MRKELFYYPLASNMTHSGNLSKMRAVLNDLVSYYLTLGDQEVDMNLLIGQPIHFSFSGKINCMACGNTTSKSFANGFCYPCMLNSPLNAACILRPELCKAHLGEGRDMEWEKAHHLQPHVVYLAVASGLKVGVTRTAQIPTRWIDQGAWKAIRLSDVPNRYTAGAIEHHLKQFISDKTNWQKMLRNVKAAAIDLTAKKAELNTYLPQELQPFISSDHTITTIDYPVQRYPLSPKSVNFDKSPEISGKLAGIRGQYLLFDDGRVLNIRRHNGYHVRLNY
jgi:hypothetical protein